MKVKSLAIGILLAIMMFSVGCSASKSSSSDNSVSEEGAPAAAAQPLPSSAQDSTETAVKQASSSTSGSSGVLQMADQAGDATNRKLMYNASLYLRVKNFSEVDIRIRGLIKEAGGYVLTFEERERNGVWSGHLTAKVPAQGLSSFLEAIDQIPTDDKRRSLTSEDVSEEYVDLTSRLKVKEAMESRLLEFINKASSTDDLVKFLKEINSVQTEIETIKGRMKFIDANVAMSTVTIEITENIKDNPAAFAVQEGLWDRITGAFTHSLQLINLFLKGLLVFVVRLFPFLVLLSAIGVPVWLVWRWRKKKQR